MSTIDTPADAGRQVRALRKRSRLTQEQLANKAGVSRKFVAEFEAGHERAEMGKALRLLQAAGYSLRAEPAADCTPAVPLQNIIDDAAETIRRELGKGDPEFALRILGNTVTSISRCTEVGRLRKPPSLGVRNWDKLLAVSIGYGLRRAGAPMPAWTKPARLKDEWFPYDFRISTPEYRDLTKRQTPPELAEAGIFLREKSLTSA